MEQKLPREDTVFWQELGAAACGHAGFKYDFMEILVTWTEKYCANTVYRLDRSAYLKLFGPTAINQYQVERVMLEMVAESRVVPAPAIIAAGEPLDQPPYLILAGIPGQTAEDIWADLSRSQQLAIAEQLGDITSAIHDLPGAPLAAVEHHWGDRYLSATGYRDQMITHITEGDSATEHFRAAFVDYLTGEAKADLERAPVVCHRELAHNHIYLDRTDNVWSVSGIIDWADAMCGPEEWDIAFLWFWTFDRDPKPMRRFLATRYGRHGPPQGLARRCLGAILQTYEWDGLWAEIVAECTGQDADPVAAATNRLFPPEVFGVF